MKLERSLLVNSAVLALALGTGVALFWTRERPTTSEREARANNLFPSFPGERLLALRVRIDRRELELTRRNGTDGGPPTYTLEGDIIADAEAAESLIRGLEMAAFLRQFSATEVDRQKFGLSAPRAELRAEFSGASVQLSVGKEALTPSGTSYVEARTSDGGVRVGLMRSDALKELLVGPDDLRPRALVPYALSELSTLGFRDSGVEVDVHRGKGPAWLDGKGRRVRRDSIEHLVFELGTLKGEPFLELGAARAALDRDGALSATFTTKTGGKLSMRVGSACPSDPGKLIAERSTPNPAAACVAGGVRGLFRATAGNLADTSLFALHADEVESLLIEREGKKLELARVERGFLLRSPARAEVALNLGNARLSALLEVRGEVVSAPNLDALGLTLPLGSVRLRSSSVEGSELFDEVLDLGRPRADGQLPVRRRDDGAVFFVTRQEARAYWVDSTLLRSPKLFDFGPSDVSKLEVSWEGEREVLVRGPGGTLELSEPKGMQHDGALALELLQALGTLQTERWIADADDGSFGFQHPRAKVQLTRSPRDAGPSTTTLVVGSETSGGSFAELDTNPGVFVLDKSVVTRLTTLLLTRALLGDAPSFFERIELTRRGKTLALVKRGSEFVPAPGSGLPAPLIARSLEALSNLRAEAALHTGPARADEGFTTPSLVVRLIPKADGGPPRVLTFGASDTFQELRVFYARRDGVDATYAVAQSAIRDLMDLFQ